MSLGDAANSTRHALLDFLKFIAGYVTNNYEEENASLPIQWTCNS